MKSIRLFAALLVLAVSACSYAGGPWFDDFDYTTDANWAKLDGKTTGTLSTTHALGTRSYMLATAPAETRPTQNLHDSNDAVSAGLLNLWVYDDGSDIKQFDVTVLGNSTTVSLGLRDNTAGSSTNYTYAFGSTVNVTTIARSTGWHLFQFAVGASGTKVQIDKKDWSGNTFAGLTLADKLVIYSNFYTMGIAGPDSNTIWIDSVQWIPGAAAAVLPASARVYTFEPFENGTSHWSPRAGTNSTISFITDDGADGTKKCMDVHDPDGNDRGVSGLFTGVVPFAGSYRVGFQYQNGPNWQTFGDFPVWGELTVTVNGTASVNLGSTKVSAFTYGETAILPGLAANADLGIDITASGSPTVTGSLARFDSMYLVVTSLGLPAAVNDWSMFN